MNSFGLQGQVATEAVDREWAEGGVLASCSTGSKKTIKDFFTSKTVKKFAPKGDEQKLWELQLMAYVAKGNIPFSLVSSSAFKR